MEVHYSSKSNEWATPQHLFNKLDEVHNFTLDPCSTHENHKCEKYFTIEDDGLNQSWEGHIVFMNPPYGRGIKNWIKKAYEESLKDNTKIVCLIPARTDTTYWHDYIFPYATEILFVRGRIKFGDGTSPAPFPSAIVMFGGEGSFIGTYKQNT